MVQVSLTAWLTKPTAPKEGHTSVIPLATRTLPECTTLPQPCPQSDHPNGEQNDHLDTAKAQEHSKSQGFVRDSKNSLPPNVELSPITSEFLPAFRRLNRIMFPIPYQDKFYNDTVSDPTTASISLIALWHDTPQDSSSSSTSRPHVVAAIRCRLLPRSPSSPLKWPSKHDGTTSPSLYISTMATLSPFRNQGIAQALLQRVAKRAVDDYGVKTISAHVWESNTEGRQWYAKHGFKEVHFEENYYRKLNPDGAWVVERPIGIADFLN